MSLSLVLLAAVAVAPATMAQDRLEGTEKWTFNECYPGPPNEEIPVWIGTLDFDGEVYDAPSWSVGTGRPYGHVPAGGYTPFNEVFAVYRDVVLVLGPECGRRPRSLCSWRARTMPEAAGTSSGCD
ncbi:MAG: hypothetical protein PVG27_07800 [Chloroflexota bacterium]|jgi:hypothetical protein